MADKNKDRIKPTFSLSHLLTCRGYTLLELLTVLAIIGFMVTGAAISWQHVFGRYNEDVPVAAAIKDMTAIQDAIVNRIYPDIGWLPSAGEDTVFGIPLLCSSGKGCLQEIDNSRCNCICKKGRMTTITIGEFECIPVKVIENLGPECRAFVSLLTGIDSPDIDCTPHSAGELKWTCNYPGYSESGILKERVCKPWNKYRCKGWNGPYLEDNATLNATYFDPGLFPPDPEGNDIYLPAIVTPWAGRLEERAVEAGERGEDDLAREYRKGKYYQILGSVKRCLEWDSHGNCKEERWEIPRDRACVFCRGKDGIDQGGRLWRSCEEDCIGKGEDDCRAKEQGCLADCENAYEACMAPNYVCVQEAEQLDREQKALKAESDECMEGCSDALEQCCEDCCPSHGFYRSKCISACKIGKNYNWMKCGYCLNESCPDCIDIYNEWSARYQEYQDKQDECREIAQECESKKSECQDICDAEAGECRASGSDSCRAECLRKIKIADPDHPDYVNIDDDILMFVFSGGLRSPLDE